MSKYRYIPLVVLFVSSLVFASFSSGAEFTFDFVNDNSNGVYEDASGLDLLDDWSGADFDDNKTGGFFFELAPGQPLVGVQLNSSDYLNVIGSGLGDGSGGFNPRTETNEFVSFTFSETLKLTYLDFASYTAGGGDAMRISVNGTEVSNLVPPNPLGDDDKWDLDIFVPANQELKLESTGGYYYLESMTVAAVPEPATVMGILVAGGMILLSRKRLVSKRRC